MKTKKENVHLTWLKADSLIIDHVIVIIKQLFDPVIILIGDVIDQLLWLDPVGYIYH